LHKSGPAYNSIILYYNYILYAMFMVKISSIYNVLLINNR